MKTSGISSYVGEYRDSGSGSSFYTIKNHKGIGFKTFETKYKAQFAHNIQSVLCESDMAPRVYGDIGRIRVCGNKLTDWGVFDRTGKANETMSFKTL